MISCVAARHSQGMTNDFLNDPLLMAFDTLPAHKLLRAKQVALLLETSTRWLDEQRAKGSPPPWVQTAGIAYAVGPLRTWLQQSMAGAPATTHAATKAKAATIAGLDEPIRKGGKRKTPKQPTFAAFLTTGLSSDEWPFVLVGDSQRPVDFIAHLLADIPPDDRDEECLWLTLEDYTSRLGDAARFEQAMAEKEAMEKALPRGRRVRRPNPL
jgi:hypothetical protein